MTADLEALRDHARRSATADHKAECAVIVQTGFGVRSDHPDPACPGCVTDRDRALWVQIAEEIDQHLDGGGDGDMGLFA